MALWPASPASSDGDGDNADDDAGLVDDVRVRRAAAFVGWRSNTAWFGLLLLMPPVRNSRRRVDDEAVAADIMVERVSKICFACCFCFCVSYWHPSIIKRWSKNRRIR